MKSKTRCIKAFTLLELLIVIVILGILAALAIPTYQNQMTKSYKQEAIIILQNFKESAVRYKSVKLGSFLGMTPANLDYDPEAVIGGQLRHFSYTLSNVGAGTFTMTAVCVDTNGAGKAKISGCAPAQDTISIDQVGVIVFSGMFQ